MSRNVYIYMDACGLNGFFASVFNVRASCPQDTQLLELEIGDGEMSEVPIIHKEMISGLLCQLGSHKSVGPDGIHCQVFRTCLDLLLGDDLVV